MSAKEESCKKMDFGCCQPMMSNCSNHGKEGGKEKKFDFKSCEQMMKQCCNEKDGKFDFEQFQSQIAKHFKGMNKENS